MSPRADKYRAFIAMVALKSIKYRASERGEFIMPVEERGVEKSPFGILKFASSHL